MKKLISLLTLIAFTTSAFGAGGTTNIKVDTTDGIHSVRNFAKNPGFEGPGIRNWTPSAGTLTTTSTAANLESGSFSGSWAATGGAGRTLDSSSVTITSGDGLSGQNGVVSCKFKAASGTATHTLTAFDGTNNLATPTTITSSTTGFVRTSVNFIFPASGTVKLRISSVSAAEPTLYIDSCYFGLADGFNLGSVSQATFVGSAYFPLTASCVVTRTSTTLGAFGTTAACPGPTVEFNPGPGVIQTTDADSNGIVTVNSLPPGYYEVTMSSRVYLSASGSNAALAINDGTTTSGQVGFDAITTGGTPAVVTGYFNYTTTANHTFNIWGTSGAGTLSWDVQGGNGRSTFSIKRYPTTSETVYRADNLNFNDTATTVTPSAGFGTTTGQSTFVSREGNRATFRGYFKAGTTAASTASIALPSGYVIDSTKLNSSAAGQSVGKFWDIQTGVTKSFGTDGKMGPVFYDGSTTGSVFITFSSASDVFTKVNGSAIITTGDGISFEFTVPISGWVQSVNAPVFVGSVTSNSTGAERIERVKVTNTAGAWTAVSQSGSWVSSITDNAVGDATIVVPSGMFSAAPTCVCTITNGTNPPTCQTRTPTTTAVRVVLVNQANTAFQDSDFDLVCMGPR